jgi:uncharacterized protein (TIGR03067 family)
MLRLGLAMFALLCTCLPLAADDKDDWKKLIGEWTPIGLEMAGTKFEASTFKDAKLTITQDKYVVLMNGTTDKGDLKIDTSKKIKIMDIVGVEGPNKGKTIPAIYEFDGEMLKVCYTLEGKDRPEGFKTTKENGGFFAVYQKAKAK